MNTIQTLKGFRDFLPLEARKRQYVINTLRSVFESFGFEPLETPALEYEEILTGKYGDEGDKLMYRFKDNGERNVAMRYDQTVPLARVVAQYQNELPMPFKRYQIQPVWRAENTQKGRFREFIQCDIDTVGTLSPLADAEIIATAAKCLEKLGFKDYKILLNDRKIFEGIPNKAIIIIDKLKKIGPAKVQEELKANGLDENILLDIKKAETTETIEAIMPLLAHLGVKNLAFEQTLARGLDYYTSTIFEVEIEGYPVGSVCGGGRYDKLIGMFAGKDIPAVGCAFGFDRIIEAMDELHLFPEELQTTKVLVSIFNTDLQEKAVEISSLLRKNNINNELYLDGNAKMEKQLKYADAKQIPYVIIQGPDEVVKDTIILKNLATREQNMMTIEEVIKILQ